jgi:2-methylcitrate dehydratase PrpD
VLFRGGEVRPGAPARLLRHGERALQDGHPAGFGVRTAVESAAGPRIDALRARKDVRENPCFSRGYRDPSSHSIASAAQVFFRDGTATERIEVEYPLGHRRRRREALPLLRAKFAQAVGAHLAPRQAEAILELADDPARLEAISVDQFVELWVS